MDRGPPGEGLPTSQDDIDIAGAYLETAAAAAGHFGRDQAGAQPKKRVIDQLAGPAVVDDRAAHALDRLLRAVAKALFALSIAEWITIGDLPDCGLRAVALPVAGLALAHGVPAAFVLPVIIATAQREMLLRPDDLRAQLEPTSCQPDGGDVAEQSRVPDISDIASKQCISLPPVGAIVVEH